MNGDKFILLTGATGFLGSKMLKGLLDNGKKVIVIKREKSDISRIRDLIDRVMVYDSEYCDYVELFKTHNIEIVIHMATTYGRGDADKVSVIEGNLLFPLRILDAAIKNKCDYFINTSSFFCKQIDERFEKGKQMYMQDYTLSKWQFQQWGKLAANSGNINFITMQLEHIFGEDDSDGKFLAMIEKKMLNKEPSIELTDGIQLRDFTPADDVVKTFMKLINSIYEYSGYHTFEVGTGHVCSVRDFVEKMKSDLNSDIELKFGAIERSKLEIMYSSADKDSPYLTTRL